MWGSSILLEWPGSWQTVQLSTSKLHLCFIPINGRATNDVGRRLFSAESNVHHRTVVRPLEDGRSGLIQQQQQQQQHENSALRFLPLKMCGMLPTDAVDWNELKLGGSWTGLAENGGRIRTNVEIKTDRNEAEDGRWICMKFNKKKIGRNWSKIQTKTNRNWPKWSQKGRVNSQEIQPKLVKHSNQTKIDQNEAEDGG